MELAAGALVGIALIVLMALAGALLAARLADGRWPDRAPSPIPQLAAFAPWAIPLWALAAALGAGTGRWAPAAVSTAGLLTQVIWQSAGRRQPAPAAPASTRGRVLAAREQVRTEAMTGLTVVSVNALLGRADPLAIGRLVRRAGADVLVVQELTLELARELDDALRDSLGDAGLRQAVLHPAPGGAGTGIWSRWPIRPVRLLPTRNCAMPQVLVQPPGASPVLLTGVHTVAPHPARLADWRADLATLAQAARTSSGPQIYAGDFNASRDHAGFRQILAAGLADAADVAGSGSGGSAGSGAGFTWPANRAFPPLTRLDHVLVSDAVAVDAFELATIPGTDHRAVVAHLALPARLRPVSAPAATAGAASLATLGSL